jgi:hypothetical protein
MGVVSFLSKRPNLCLYLSNHTNVVIKSNIATFYSYFWNQIEEISVKD